MRANAHGLIFAALVVGCANGAPTVDAEGRSSAAAESIASTKVMDCKTDDDRHFFYLLFNRTPIAAARAAVMAAHTTPGSPSTDFHPLYGPTRFAWSDAGLSMTFEATVPITDWSREDLVDDCYSTSQGGYYMFENMQFTASGGLRGTWHSPDKYVVAPNASCPPGEPPPSDPPSVGIACELAPGVVF